MEEFSSRRKYLAACAGTLLIAGCIGSDSDRDPKSELLVISDTYRRNGTWYADLEINHYHHRVADLHNVTVIGYSKTGSQVCRVEAGDSIQPATLAKHVTVECEKFPYIFAVTADESPCKDGLTFEISRWNGPEEYRLKKDPKDEVVDYYETFERRCGEELPPERLLPDDPETTTDASTDS